MMDANLRPASFVFLSRALGLLVLIDLLLMSQDLFRLFGPTGIVDTVFMRSATADLPLSFWPYLPEKSAGAVGQGVIAVLFAVVAMLSVMSLAPSRKWGVRVALYLFFTAFKHNIGFATYGVHEFIQIALFYLAVGDVAAGMAPEGYRWTGLALRVHLSIGYLFAGLSKATGEQWWSGEAVWRSINRTDSSGFAWLNLVPLGQWPILFQIAAIGTIFTEGLYPLAFIRQLRPIFVGGMILMHLMTVFAQGLLIFGPVMISLNVFFWLDSLPKPADAAPESDPIPVAV